MARQRRLELVISGDASSAVGSLLATDRAAGRSAGRIGSAGKAIGLAFAGVTAAVGAAGVASVAALYQIGSQFDQAYDTIRVGTGATGSQLEDLKDSFRSVAHDVPSSMGDISTAIADLNTRLGLTGGELETVSTQMLNLSRITGTDVATNIENISRVFGDWGLTTGPQMSDGMDMIYRAAQATGIGLDQLSTQVVQFGSPMRQLGFSFEEALAIFGKFEQEGVNIETVMSGMRQAVARFSRDGMAPMEGMEDVMARVEAGTFTAADAMETFGARAGPDMFAALQEGRFSIDELVGQIVDGSDTINQAAEDTESAGEKWERLKNRIMLALEPLATEVFDGVGEAMDELAPMAQRLMDEWGPRFERIGQEIGDRLPVAMAWLQEKADEVLPVLRDAFAEVAAAVEEKWPEIRDTAIEVFESIASITESSIDIITTLWERFGDDVFNGFSERIGAVLTFLKGAFDIVAGLFSFVAALVEGDWGGMWDAVLQILGGAVDVVKGAVGLLWQNILFVFRAAGEVLGGVFSGTWDFLVGVAESAADRFVGIFRGAVDVIAWVWNGLKDIFKDVGNWVIRHAINPFIRGVNTVAGAIGLGNLLSELPTFHTGGVVPGTGETPAVLMGGEGVLPVEAMRNLSADQFELLRQGKTDAIGDGPGFLGLSAIDDAVSRIGSSVANTLRSAAVDLARPAISAAMSLLDRIPFPGAAGDMFGGSARWMGDRVLDWLEGVERLAKEVMVPDLGAGIGWKAMWQAVQAKFPGAALHSGFRPGSITATGRQSYHALGRAIDISPRMDIFDWIVENYGPQSREVIFSPAEGRQIHNGAPHIYGEPTRGMHFDHVHWAMQDGGDFIVRRPTTFLSGEAGPERATFTPLRGNRTTTAVAEPPVVIENHLHVDTVVGADEKQLIELLTSAARKGFTSTEVRRWIRNMAN